MEGRRRTRSVKKDDSACSSKDESNEIMKDVTNLTFLFVKEANKTWSCKNKRKSSELKRALPLTYSRLHLLEKNLKDFICKLVLLQDEYENISEEYMKTLPVLPVGESRGADNMQRHHHVRDLTLLTIVTITDFTRKVFGFDTLSSQDQITLLKGCTMEVLLLRLARKYDPKTDTTSFGNDFRFTRDSFLAQGMGDFSYCIFDFCRTLSCLNIDNAEYALITAMRIFCSGRPFLNEASKVNHLQTFYSKNLETYVGICRKPEKNFLEKLFSKLNELRQVGDIRCQKWLFTEIPCEEIPQSIKELLEIKD